MLVRKCFLAMLMLILMLLDLYTDYAHIDACMRMISLHVM